MSAGLLDTPGTQTAGAEGDIAWGPFQENAMARDIELLPAFTDIMGVADLTADPWPSSADFAL